MRKKEEREMKKKYSWFNLGMLGYLRDVIHVRLSNNLPIVTLASSQSLAYDSMGRA